MDKIATYGSRKLSEALNSILDDCLKFQREPSDEQRELARELIERDDYDELGVGD